MREREKNAKAQRLQGAMTSMSSRGRAMRAALKASTTSNTRPKKEHGKSGGDGVGVDAMPTTTRVLADVPATVPELPNAYLVRDEDLLQLRAALLAEDGESGMALTSKKQQNKVGAHGMVSLAGIHK